MNYDFNSIIDRHNTNSIKHDFIKEYNMPEDVIPLWVADMDFQAPMEVISCLQTAVAHGIFGYSDTKEDYFLSVSKWYSSNFNWKVQPDWLVKTPGVVFALNLAVKAFTKEHECVLIQRPVYHPFTKIIEANQRTLINNPLRYDEQRYYIDFDTFEKTIIKNQIKLFIFCSPHNPVGRVWSRHELEKIGAICLKHNVIIVSDEIHADFTYTNHPHTVLASISKEISNITITCTAPSKTFNLAGLQVSNIFIENMALREAFLEELSKTAYHELNSLGLIACQSAYNHGRSWLNELLSYLMDNVSFVRSFLNEYLPKIKMIEPEGTYLIWLDFSAYQMTLEELDYLLIHDAKLWLNSGILFGLEGAGFQRMNIACPRFVLQQAMNQLKDALDAYELKSSLTTTKLP